MLAAAPAAPCAPGPAAATATTWMPQLNQPWSSGCFSHAPAAQHPSSWGLQVPHLAAPAAEAAAAAAAAATQWAPPPRRPSPPLPLTAQPTQGLPAQLQQRPYAQVAAAEPRRRRGCTRCVCCTPAAMLRSRRHSGRCAGTRAGAGREHAPPACLRPRDTPPTPPLPPSLPLRCAAGCPAAAGGTRARTRPGRGACPPPRSSSRCAASRCRRPSRRRCARPRSGAPWPPRGRRRRRCVSGAACAPSQSWCRRPTPTSSR